MNELQKMNEMSNDVEMVVWRTNEGGEKKAEVTSTDPGSISKKERSFWYHATDLAFAAIAAAGSKAGNVNGLSVLPGGVIFRCPTVPLGMLMEHFQALFEHHGRVSEDRLVRRAWQMWDGGAVRVCTDRNPLLVPDRITGGLSPSPLWSNFWEEVVNTEPPTRLVVLDRLAISAIPGLSDEEMARIAQVHLSGAAKEISSRGIKSDPGRHYPRGIVLIDIAMG